MSEYRHNLVKFADTGLQLRLPVDLVPSTQYSKLTNAVPRIEGEIRTREGMSIVSRLFQISAISVLSRVDTSSTFMVASTATTIYPNEYQVGDTVIITVTDSVHVPGVVGYGQGPYGAGFYGGASGIIPGVYVVTVTTIVDPFTFTFAPGIPGVWPSGVLSISVFAQAIDTSLLTSTQSVDTIYRLNQALPHIMGDRLVAMAGRMYWASLPLGIVFHELIHPPAVGVPPNSSNGFSGNPLSIISFRFTLDTASWAIISDTGVMYKFREDTNGNPLFFFLGNPQPTVGAQAVADGAGLLDSTGGALYDWRYTYFDGYVGTEGNPSPPAEASTTGTNRAGSTTSPDPKFPQSHAFISATTTSGHGIAHQLGGLIQHQVSCRWQGFTNPAGTPYTKDIVVTWSATITKKNAASVEAQLNYSVDNGITFTRFATVIDISSGVITSTATLPLGTDLTKVIIQSFAICSAGPGTSMNLVDINITDIYISTVSVPISGAIAAVNQNVNVQVALPTENDGRITAIRLYRRGGSLPDAWRLVGTFSLDGLAITTPPNMVTLNDNVSDTQLSTQLIMQFDNDQPVTSVEVTNQPLSFIWGPAGIDARVLGCGDPNRPECVYYSKPGNADAWPPQNFVEVCDPGTPVIAGCVYNTRNYAFSREGIYELVEGLGTGSTFTPFKTPSAHGLYSPWGLALGPEIFFVAKDGIYVTSGGQEVSIVENDIKPLFPTYDSPGHSVEGYDAVDYSDPNDLRLVYHNDELYFIYLGLETQTQQLLIYDLVKKRWRAADYNSEITTLYSEPAIQSSLLGGTLIGELTQAGGETDPDSDIFVTVQTGAQDQGMPLNRKQYGNVIFDLDPGGADALHPVTITPRINGEVTNQAAITVTGTGRQQVPLDLSDYFAFNTEFLITWDKFDTGGGHYSEPVLYQFDTLFFPEPVGVRHWESQPSSMQLLGFGHIRDMYVAIRSTADVTMTMTIDTGKGAEVVQTYTVPSTGGERRKVYMPLNSNKGLLYRFALDSTQEFRLYAEDIEVRTKGWLTVLGYTIAKPFGMEAGG